MPRVRTRLLAMLLAAVLSGAPSAGAATLPGDVAAMIEASSAAGLPREPLEFKAREGLAKGVPDAVVLSALRDLADRMQRASDTLGAAANGPDRAALLTSGAAALRAGVSISGLARAASTPAGKGAVAVQTLSDLVSMGVPEDRSLLLIERRSAAADGGAGIVELSSTVAGLLGQGMSPSAAVEWVSTSHGGAGPGSTPAYGAGGKNDKDPKGKGLDKAPGQQKK